MKKLTNHVLLTEDEYNELANPEKCYTFLTKTMANKAVKNLLKFHKFLCYHDDPEVEDYDDACCSACPVIQVLGHEAGSRICTRQKYWSK